MNYLILLLLYVALCWGLFSARMQYKLDGNYKYVWVAFLLNFVGWPIAMPWAIYNCPVKPDTAP